MNLPLNIDIQQILLHMLNFVILFAVLYFLLYKPVKKFIDDREAEYKKAADEAKGKLEKADKALSGLDAALADKRPPPKRNVPICCRRRKSSIMKRSPTPKRERRP